MGWEKKEKKETGASLLISASGEQPFQKWAISASRIGIKT